MKPSKTWFPLFLATLAVVFYASGNLMAQGDHHSAEHQHAMEHHREMKIGKNGVFTFDEAFQIGDEVMKAGRYKFQHREEGCTHFVRFQMAGSGDDTGDVPCKVEPLDGKADHTPIYKDGSVSPAKVVKIVVRGENVAHVL